MLGTSVAQYKLRTEGEQSTAGDETTETVSTCARAMRITKKYASTAQKFGTGGDASMIDKQFI